MSKDGGQWVAVRYAECLHSLAGLGTRRRHGRTAVHWLPQVRPRPGTSGLGVGVQRAVLFGPVVRAVTVCVGMNLGKTHWGQLRRALRARGRA